MFKFTCDVCKREFKGRFEVHTQGTPNGWRYICCECLGHKPLSCTKEESKR